MHAKQTLEVTGALNRVQIRLRTKKSKNQCSSGIEPPPLAPFTAALPLSYGRRRRATRTESKHYQSLRQWGLVGFRFGWFLGFSRASDPSPLEMSSSTPCDTFQAPKVFFRTTYRPNRLIRSTKTIVPPTAKPPLARGHFLVLKRICTLHNGQREEIS